MTGLAHELACRALANSGAIVGMTCLLHEVGALCPSIELVERYVGQRAVRAGSTGAPVAAAPRDVRVFSRM